MTIIKTATPKLIPINDKIETELKSLIDLKNVKDNNPELRALAYHL